MRNIIQYVLCLHSQLRVTHWISFLCQFSLSLWCFWFGLPSQCIHQRVSQACLLCIMKPSKSHLPLILCRGEENGKWMFANNMLSHYFISEESQKRCKNVVNVWLKVSLAGLHISDSFVYQRNTIELKKKKRKICCIVYKVMFIQYFNITSDFRGRYLNRILYLHVKMSTAVYWYSAAIYNKGFDRYFWSLYNIIVFSFCCI